MKLTKRQFQFIINCDVEQMIEFLMKEQGKSMVEAFDIVYNSTIYQKLTNEKTGLYLQSPEYIYYHLQEEMLSNKQQ